MGVSSSVALRRVGPHGVRLRCFLSGTHVRGRCVNVLAAEIQSLL